MGDLIRPPEEQPAGSRGEEFELGCPDRSDETGEVVVECVCEVWWVGDLEVGTFPPYPHASQGLSTRFETLDDLESIDLRRERAGAGVEIERDGGRLNGLSHAAKLGRYDAAISLKLEARLRDVGDDFM